MTQIKFNQGQQRQFIEYCSQVLGISLKQLATRLKISYEILKKYKRERCLINEKLFLKICKLSKINFRELEISKLGDNWGQVKGGKLGIIRMQEKYQNKLKLWRARGGKKHFLKS